MGPWLPKSATHLTSSPRSPQGVRVIHDDLTLLSEPIRVRVLRLVERDELGVGELSSVLQLPQSTVSRHLKALMVAGWVSRRAAGTSSLIRMDGDRLEGTRARLWSLVKADLADDPAATQDAQRVAAVLDQRRVDTRTYFGRVASRWDQVREELFGADFTLASVAALLDRDLVVADLGCGTGGTAQLLAPAVGRVIAVDYEEAMLEGARARLAGFDNVDLRLGALTALPIEDASVDRALAMLVLHHVEAIGDALAEIRRVLKPGGTLVVLDMTAHDRESYRHTMGHVHLGFARDALAGLAVEAGLVPVSYNLLAPVPEAQGPGLFIATFEVTEKAPR